MAMIGIHEMNSAALDDAEVVRTFALEPESFRDTAPSISFARASLESISVFAHADAVNLPGVRLVRL